MRIELFSDMICPFCYIGKRNLDVALASFAHRGEVEIVHRSFQLDPSAARVAGETLPEREMRFHGLPRSAVDARLAMVAEMAKNAGLDYRLDRALPVHTVDAHRLMHFAAVTKRAGELAENLLHACAVEGRSIADHDTLVQLAVDAGLDADGARAVLDSAAFHSEVEADLRRAVELGVFGVPAGVVDGEWQLDLMTAPSRILRALEVAWQEVHA
ncbi:DsbA family oxidoreductase [Pseudonocardia sp. TRM90224]|uniref:DsbA family oxidoreductase n=1 Tax=Pseudonocardia sp. TRM90224 TaxID=2812678 RepID=UPI001E3E6D9D|nr:DsbA family oxidoreductase [Pseudonocardia sp. TRM90224]